MAQNFNLQRNEEKLPQNYRHFSRDFSRTLHCCQFWD